MELKVNSRANYFKVVISPYIKSKLMELEFLYGKDSWEYQSIAKQYEFNQLEDKDTVDHNSKHYEASTGLTNVERLYKHHACVEINFSCAGHCRYCLRSNYDGFQIKDNEIDDAVKFIYDNQLDEILITGGDPFLSPSKLGQFISKIVTNCSTIKFIRIATRTFTQNPNLVTEEILSILKEANKICKVEVATQIGSPIELEWPETREAFKQVLDLGIPVYSQNVFMKGINDTPEHLIQIYERMRELGITPHYLFHAVPLKATHHFRPTIDRMIDCYEELVNSGSVTGRSKPILALMTAIGKVTLTPKNVIEYKKGEYMSVRSRYKLTDRLEYNPEFKLPEDSWVDEDGYLCIKYQDGSDD